MVAFLLDSLDLWVFRDLFASPKDLKAALSPLYCYFLLLRYCYCYCFHYDTLGDSMAAFAVEEVVDLSCRFHAGDNGGVPTEAQNSTSTWMATTRRRALNESYSGKDEFLVD